MKKYIRMRTFYRLCLSRQYQDGPPTSFKFGTTRTQYFEYQPFFVPAAAILVRTLQLTRWVARTRNTAVRAIRGRRLQHWCLLLRVCASDAEKLSLHPPREK